MTPADRVAALLLLVFASVVIAQAARLPYWTGQAPGPGFLPFWLGILLAAASAVVLGRTRHVRGRDRDDARDRPAARRVAVVIALAAATGAATLAIGLVVASGLFTLATLTYLRPARFAANAITAIATPLTVWMLFVRWLGVPLPAGIFGF